MKKKLFFILFTLLSFVFFVPQLYSTIQIESLDHPLMIGKSIEYLEDPDGKLTIESVSTGKLEWKQSHKENINTGTTEHHFWYRFTVQNNEKQSLFLNINYAQIMEINFYYRQQNGKWHHSKSGCRYPQKQREIDHRHYNFKLSDLKEEVTYYIHIEPLFNLTMKPGIYSRDQLFHVQKRDDIICWLYIGFALFSILFNLLFFINNRKKNYIYLIFYILGWLGFHLTLGGIAFQYIWPNSPLWDQKSFLIFTPVLGVFAILFFRNFLDTRNYKWIDRAFLYLLLPAAIMDIGVALFAPPAFAMTTTSIRGIIFTIFNLSIAAYIMIKHKKKSALFLFIGFLGIPFSIIFMAMEASGIMSLGLLSPFTNILSNFWLVAWLSVGVSYKFTLVEQRAKKSEREYELLKDAIMDGYLIYDHKGIIQECNDAFCDMMKCKREDLYLTNVSNLIAKKNVSDDIITEQLTKRGYTDVFEKAYYRCDKKSVPIEFRIYHVLEQKGHPARLMEIVRDISKRKESEKQLRHSQKIDAVGKLAGGIAHDFNNMLAGIMGGAEIMKYRLNEKNFDICKKYVDIILDTSKRASRLTNQLLNISRSSDTVKQEIDINRLLLEVTQLLERTIDKKIKIHLDTDSSFLKMIGDKDRIHNAILNLGINARDALSNGGLITFSSTSLVLNKEEIERWGVELEQGKYIKVSIEDDGCGIAPENLEKIFDPYFTTKKTGKGTGLGLASVYGTIQDHHGYISVNSIPGKGSCFDLYFKESIATSDSKNIESQALIYKGTGNILLAEDDPAIQEVLEELISSLGYTITNATDGELALQIYLAEPERFDLIFLDVIMPQKSGVEVFYAINKNDPDIPVILASGYANKVDIEKLTKDGLSGFIKKPFNRQSISALLHKILNS